MAQFLFESDLNGLLKLDAPIPNVPPARWQRKAKELAVASAGPTPDSLAPSPMKPANRPHSTSKTPSKTPGKAFGFLLYPEGNYRTARLWIKLSIL